jgi:hypothetical protein
MLLTRIHNHAPIYRELAFQLAEQFRALGAGMSLRDCTVVGGLDMQAQAKELSRRPHVVIATPGRLKVHNAVKKGRRGGGENACMLCGGIDCQLVFLLCLSCAFPPLPQGLFDLNAELTRGFARARFLVLDEADRLLEPSFEAELAAILALLPAERQTLLFSATMTRTLLALQTVRAMLRALRCGQMHAAQLLAHLWGCMHCCASLFRCCMWMCICAYTCARMPLPFGFPGNTRYSQAEHTHTRPLPPCAHLFTPLQALLRDAFLFQAYQGLTTAAGLRENYLLLPAKVKEVYLVRRDGGVGWGGIYGFRCGSITGRAWGYEGRQAPWGALAN